jgi:hypothetical protein
VSAVQSVTVTGEGFLIALPPGAVAMSAQGGGRGGRVERHHIGTIANKKSSVRGGPCREYHQIVYRRLDRALGDCRSIAGCRGRLTRELRALAEEIATPGTEANRLVTQGK